MRTASSLQKNQTVTSEQNIGYPWSRELRKCDNLIAQHPHTYSSLSKVFELPLFEKLYLSSTMTGPHYSQSPDKNKRPHHITTSQSPDKNKTLHFWTWLLP